jgi:hypothetical protein
LTGQLKESSNSASEFFALGKTMQIKCSFTNQGIVRDHHADGSKEIFQIVREFCPASISWVHGDEDAEIGIDLNVASLKIYLSVSVSLLIQN